MGQHDFLEKKFNLYDIYDFVIAVDDSANEVFRKEYGYFRVYENRSKIDIYVTASEQDEIFPTKPAGSVKGFLLPFDEKDNILRYNRGVNLNVLLNYLEALLWWSDKAFLHAGAVSKKGEAFVFMGGGNVGKTSLVLNLVRRGYKYLSDDWLILSEGKAYPFPKKIRVFDYNLKDNEIAKSVLGWKRFYWKGIFKLRDLCQKVAPHRYVRFAFENVKPTFNVDIQKLHPIAEIGSPTSISKIFYLERWDRNYCDTHRNVDPVYLAKKMAYVNMYERNYLFKEYCKYAFKFGIRSEKIESRLHHDIKILCENFKNAQLSRVIVPQDLDLTKKDLKIDLKLILEE